MTDRMEPEQLARLLRGYVPPPASAELDRRVLEHGITIITASRADRLASEPAWLEEVAHAVLHHLGFGPLAWLLDLVTTTDAEYRVEFA